MKLTSIIVSFLLGAAAGASGLAGYWYWKNSSTEVWVVKRTLQAETGIVLPVGTELILERWMPEGFAALKLGINVEGEELEDFESRIEPIAFLRIPYFAEEVGE